MTESGKRLAEALKRLAALQEVFVLVERQVANAKRDVREARDQVLREEATAEPVGARS